MNKDKIFIVGIIVAIVLIVLIWRHKGKLKISQVAKKKTAEADLSVNDADTFPLTYGNTTPSAKVRDIQGRLNYLDYTGQGRYQIAEDGLFGPETSGRLSSEGFLAYTHSISKEGYRQIMGTEPDLTKIY